MMEFLVLGEIRRRVNRIATCGGQTLASLAVWLAESLERQT